MKTLVAYKKCRCVGVCALLYVLALVCSVGVSISLCCFIPSCILTVLCLGLQKIEDLSRF